MRGVEQHSEGHHHVEVLYLDRRLSPELPGGLNGEAPNLVRLSDSAWECR